MVGRELLLMIWCSYKALTYAVAFKIIIIIMCLSLFVLPGSEVCSARVTSLILVLLMIITVRLLVW